MVAEETVLDLQDCVVLALEKNFVVRSNRFNYEKQQQWVRSNVGQFDPELSLHYSKASEEALTLPDASISNTSRNLSSGVSVSGNTLLGTRYSLGVNNYSNRDQEQGILSMASTPSAYVQVIQPLMRGGLRNEARTALKVSKKSLEVENWRFKSVVIDTVLDVVAAYADLYFASKQLEISINNRDLAAQLLKDNKKRVSMGYQAESDIILAESRSTQRQEAVFQAEVYLHTQENLVKQLISDEMLELLDREIAIVDLPSFPEERPAVAQDFPMALEENPFFQMAQLGLSIQELILMQEQFDLLPSLDLTLRYDTQGLGSDSDAGWRSLKDRDGEGWYGGLELSLPIPNRSNRAQHAIAKIETRQKELELERVQQAVLLQLDNAAFRLKKAWDRMVSSQHNRELAERSLRAEEKKLKAGRSTSFFVLDQQQRVANAQLQEIRSKVDYFKSLSVYHKERGTLLDVYAVQLPLVQASQ